MKKVTYYIKQNNTTIEMAEVVYDHELNLSLIILEKLEKSWEGTKTGLLKSARYVLWTVYRKQLSARIDDIPF